MNFGGDFVHFQRVYIIGVLVSKAKMSWHQVEFSYEFFCILYSLFFCSSLHLLTPKVSESVIS